MIPTRVHPQAYVADAILGQGVTVWQFASVTGGTVLGDGCSVSPFAMLHGPRFGARCVISGGVMMGPGFVLGDDCFVGPNVVLCNDMWPAADKTGLDLDALRSGEFVTVRVGNGVCLGAGCIILPGVTIGDGAVISAGAVCGKDVPAGHLFKRDGKIVEITADWTKRRRMRRAKAA
jgi:acetyltransferase-like isoleucine patch superfamily enzyme